MDIFHLVKAAILGLIEGATEFIPVSSTGHLILAQKWLALAGEKQKAFEVFIQLGAILAVVWLYRRKLWSVLTGLRADPRARQLAVNLVVGTLPVHRRRAADAALGRGPPRESRSRWAWRSRSAAWRSW